MPQSRFFQAQSARGNIDHLRITGGVGIFHKESAAVPSVNTTPSGRTDCLRYRGRNVARSPSGTSSEHLALGRKAQNKGRVRS